LQDRLTEGIVLATMEAGEQLYHDPQDVTARANLCWCSTVALCGLVQSGRGGSWALHGMEHALSGHYDISHGRGLAILFPRLMAHCLKEQPAKYAQFARRIFRVNDPDDQPAARQGLDMFIKWLDGIGLYQTLSDVGIGDDKFDQMVDDTLALYSDPSGYIDAQYLIDRQGIIDIYRASLK
jgi:alcohol dehydrogenase YqhD (iron-dependent ADH family)